MSQVEKTRRKLEKSNGKNPLRHRGSFVMKKSAPVIYNRRCKEECQQLDTERDKADGGHSSASSGDQQIQPEHELKESIQPGTVRRLVEKFRRLGESTFNNKPSNQNVPSKRLSGTLTEGFAIVRKKSERLKKGRMTEEKWILLTPSLFSPHELDSCSISLLQPTTIPVIHRQKPSQSAVHTKHRGRGLQDIVLESEHDTSEMVLPTEHIMIENPAEGNKRLDSCSDSLSQPTIPAIHRQKPSQSAVHTKHRVGGLQDIILSCEHDVSEIVLPIERLMIDNPTESNKRLTIGASRNYIMPNDKADDQQIYEEIKTVETLDCPEVENVVPPAETKEILEGISQKDLIIVNNDALYEEIEIKPLQEFCCVPSLVILRKERLYEEIDAESIAIRSEDLNHSNAGNITGKRSGIAFHPSNSAQNFMPPDESVYEEIDLSPPMIVVREPNFSSSSSFGTSDSNKSENLAVPGSQCEDCCSASSVFEESSSTDSVISDLDGYDIVYMSEVLGLELSRMDSDISSSDLDNSHRKRSMQNISTSMRHSSSDSEICRKPKSKSCQCRAVSSKTSETSECKKNTKETATGCNDQENIYEDYDFTPAIVSRQGPVNNNTKRKHVAFNNTTTENGPLRETGGHELGLPTDGISESSSRNSISSSSYDSFSSDDEYEDAPGDHVVLMQRAEEPPSDSSTEEPLTKLDRIIREVIDTERKYIERLKLINDEFRVVVTTWNQEKNYIPADIVRQMFLNIDVIYQLHSGYFLPELEACINKEIRRKIEDVFIKGADFLKLYAEYSCCFSKAMKLIEQWKVKVPEFSRFILGIQQKPVCHSFTLEHHMLEPILRIPRYELLLNKYLENLPEDSLEREKSLKAVQKVTAAASHCNDLIKSMEKYRKVMDVQQSLWNKVDLMTPSRELILDGRMKVTQQQCKDEDKHLFLFNDTLLVCKIFPLGITPPFKMLQQLDIDGMRVVDRQKEEVVETFFVFCTQGYLEMHPGSKEEKEKWISALNGVITKYMALEKSRGNVLQNSSYSRQKSIPGTQAPIWIKDPQANRCMQCDEKFTAIKRRHHCRACGIVVCGKCSSKEASLAFDNFSQQHRVCDKCFSEIPSSTKDDSESEAKVSHSLVRNVQRRSKKDAADSEHRTSVFFILPCDEHSPCHLKEEQTVTELPSRLEAIIETEAESKDIEEQVT